MSELASLEDSLRDLLSKLDSTTCPIILGGGYGLYLRRTKLENETTRTLLEHWPEARSTNDLDLFLRPELLCDSTRLSALKSALDELGYTPVKGAEHYQFRKDDPNGFIERGIKIDLLTGPSSSFEGTDLRVDERRVRPNPSVKIHAHPTDEAITLDEQLQEIEFRSSQDEKSEHDLYSIVAMMTEPEWEQAKTMVNENSNSMVGREAHRIVIEKFDTITSRGLLVMRANPYCSDQLQLPEFIELIQERFQ